MKIKVLIADDNSFIREGMKIILNTFGDFDVVATVADGREAVEYCRNHEVDVALLDVRMPNMNGVEATKMLTGETSAKPLILTTFDDDEYIVDAIRFGAKGYLLKNNDPERIRDAIKSVYNGHSVLQDVVLDKLKSQVGGGQEAKAGSLPEADRKQAEGTPKEAGDGRDACPFDRSLFTERELEVMSLIAQGLSNKEISKELFISEGTTANYITSILNKTALSHRTQIAIYYLTGKTR
ncbi:response regulator transcription factor [Paenibacillus sp. FSL M7-1455]|jgi:DNA-binding NarL/FixJ family response regulator|uniref:DNA-binding response regulator n=1 Tax=Paenibacillus cookii TaxID=157839 RepID=A0ABQ4LUP8_9BACL|nr:response regulator transcription factor [Paenibacillus cookii]GIO66663.1 DNA-binding response regulator [Paenibacillus cookii]HWO53927.1 response regulator transcription factor [Paenibacillus cookii]